MDKKLVGAICGCVAMIGGLITGLGYMLNSVNPWYLVTIVAGIICAIVSMVGGITNESNAEEKHKKLIGCICSSISMISVLIFLILMECTNIQNGWIIIPVCGVISACIYMIDNATKK